MTAAAAVVVLLVLLLWLLEKTPPFVPTLLLAATMPVLLAGEGVGVDDVVGAAAQPVLLLFFGGFVLAEAARVHRLDAVLVSLVLRTAGGGKRRLVIGFAVSAALLSMAISNVAAAALLVQVARPLVDGPDDRFRRAALLAIAFGANIGGIATPIGTGPNAIAIASIAARTGEGPSFATWMAFGLPLTLLLLVLVIGVILLLFRVEDRVDVVAADVEVGAEGAGVIFVFACCVVGWLTGPLTGIDPAVIGVGAACALFATGLVPRASLAKLDWSTLMLIAGGLMLGHALSALGVLERVAAVAEGAEAAVVVSFFVCCAACAAALMSNTATATLLIPMALSVSPSPSTAVLVAVACSLGAPFTISTPQNALVAGAGVSARDFFVTGVPVLVLGLLIVLLTGPAVLALFGLA